MCRNYGHIGRLSVAKFDVTRYKLAGSGDAVFDLERAVYGKERQPVIKFAVHSVTFILIFVPTGMQQRKVEAMSTFCLGRCRQTHRRSPILSTSKFLDGINWLSVDEWSYVALHLNMRSRRAFASCSKHSCQIERSSWRGTVFDLDTIGFYYVNWNDLWYLAKLPCCTITAGDEVLSPNSLNDSWPQDPRLCVCVAARCVHQHTTQTSPSVILVPQDLYSKRVHDCLRMKPCYHLLPHTPLSAYHKDVRWMVASLAALSRHPTILQYAVRPTLSQPFGADFETLAALLGGTRMFLWILDAIPWPWIWEYLRQHWPETLWPHGGGDECE